MIYSVTVDIPAWPKEQPDDVLAFSPSLTISRTEEGTRHTLIQLNWWIDDLPQQDRWVVRHFPPDARRLRHKWSDPSTGRDDPKFQPPLRKWRRLADGEAARDTRPTCRDALARAIELLEEMTDLEAARSVGQAIDYMKAPLEAAARSFTMKFRPPKPKPRPSTF